MNPRDRWKLLQRHLDEARQSFAEGDTSSALRSVERALAIDPDFLAAQALRDQINTGPAAARRTDVAPRAGASAGAPSPLVSSQGWARFEQRARERRIERRLAAAGAAIARKRFAEARQALSEVTELDPYHPDIVSLSMELDAAESAAAQRARWTPKIAAAAAFGGLVLGASLVNEQTGRLVSFPHWEVVNLVAGVPSSLFEPEPMPVLPEPTPALPEPSGPPPDAVVASAPELSAQPAIAPAATTGSRRLEPEPPVVRDRDRADQPRAATAAPVVRAAAVPPPVENTIASLPDTLEPAAPPVPERNLPAVTNAATTAAAAPVAPAVARASAPAPAIPDFDEQGVHTVLQRYRSAYEQLDAGRAQAVWPTVDRSALARAFDGLESQRFEFENCVVDLDGAAAKAVCRGSARYVPKVGSREPRKESRVWNFTLRRNGAEWQIESARAAR